MSLDEVAALFRRTPETIRRRWRALHREQGFPPPLPGFGLLWSAAAVRAWMRGAAFSVPANDDRPGVDAAALVAAQRAMLRQAMQARPEVTS